MQELEFQNHSINNEQIFFMRIYIESIKMIYSNEISCVTNVCRLFEEIMKNYPSLTEKIYCNKCGYNKEKIRQTISVQTQPILKQGIQCLQDCIQKVIQNQTVYCEHCQEKCKKQKNI